MEFLGRCVRDLHPLPITTVTLNKVIPTRIVAIRKWTDVRGIYINQVSEVWLQIEHIRIKRFVLLAVGEHRIIERSDRDEELLTHRQLQINPLVPAFVPRKCEHPSWPLLHTGARCGSKSH